MSEETYGQRARHLLSELQGAETLPAYNDETVRAVLAETIALDKEVESLAADQVAQPGDDGLKVPTVVFDMTIRRNKRCLLAYHSRRCDLIEELRWAYGSAGVPAEFRDKMSSAEADYFIAYSDIIAKFVSETGVDIMSDLQAPKENTIEVIALRDCGQIMTTKGQRDVREKEVHVLRKVDAEQLIRIGWLRHITDKS